MKTDRSGRTFDEYRQLYWDEQKRTKLLEREVDMWRKHVVELEATIKRVEALVDKWREPGAWCEDTHHHGQMAMSNNCSKELAAALGGAK